MKTINNKQLAISKWCSPSGFCLLLIVNCALLVACNNGQKPFEKRIDKIFKGPVFRDLTIGDSYNKVLKTENKDYMQFPDSNIIKYMYHVSDTEEYHWAYIFEEDKIKEIQFDAYLGEEKDGEKYVTILQKRYDKIWGKSANLNGIISWQKDRVSADLINESPIVLMGKVKFLIYQTGDSIFKKYVPEL